MFETGNDKSSIVIPFDKIFGRDISHVNTFILKNKRAYCNLIPAIIENNNEILKRDTKNQFIPNYLTIKYKIDGQVYKDKEEMLNEVYSLIVNDYFIDIVNGIVNEKYCQDLDSKEAKKFNAGLQFTDEHCKKLMSISVAIKFIIPLVLQYSYHNMETKTYITDYLIASFDPMFEKLSPGTDLITKLHESVFSRVVVTRKSDTVYWKYFEILGFSIEQMTDSIFRKIIIDIIPKYIFEMNPISLNSVAINNNIEFNLKFNYPINFKPMNLQDDDDDISDFDRVAINTARIDESDLVLQKHNIQNSIKMLARQHKVVFTEEELTHYTKGKDSLSVNKMQRDLLALFYAKDLGSTSIIYYCSFKEYCVLLLLMKKILEQNSFNTLNQVVLARLNNEISEKRSLNKKNLARIIESDRYTSLMEKKFKYSINNIEEQDIVIRLIATIMNNKFINNDINSNEFGQVIEINSDILSDEIIRFLEYI